MGPGRVVGVAGDAEPADDPLLPRPNQGLERSARGGTLVQLVELSHRVKLIEVQAVRPQPIERPGELRSAASLVRFLVLQPTNIRRSRRQDIHGLSRSSASP